MTLTLIFYLVGGYFVIGTAFIVIYIACDYKLSSKEHNEFMAMCSNSPLDRLPWENRAFRWLIGEPVVMVYGLAALCVLLCFCILLLLLLLLPKSVGEPAGTWILDRKAVGAFIDAYEIFC